jgi:hypothetical protein
MRVSKNGLQVYLVGGGLAVYRHFEHLESVSDIYGPSNEKVYVY